MYSVFRIPKPCPHGINKVLQQRAFFCNLTCFQSPQVSLCFPSPFSEIRNTVGLFYHIVHSLIGYLKLVSHCREEVLGETAQSVKSSLHNLEFDPQHLCTSQALQNMP